VVKVTGALGADTLLALSTALTVRV
jgi:hypothetical protein